MYRGVQLATGRKVALKLLHPEMTNDDNVVARFRREGLVLCNLRDARTITTYDFDQTPEGTLYTTIITRCDATQSDARLVLGIRCNAHAHQCLNTSRSIVKLTPSR